MQKTANKGFTLIEMLLVIVIVGILMGAVVVGVNPVKRINDAKDAVVKSNVGTVGSAIEACYTKNQATWTACDTLQELEDDGFIKEADLLTGVTIMLDGGSTNVCVCSDLNNAQVSGTGFGVDCTTASPCSYYVYRSSQGKADVTGTSYCAAAANCN